MNSSTGTKLQQDAAHSGGPLAKPAGGEDVAVHAKQKRRRCCFVWLCLAAAIFLATIIIAVISLLSQSGPAPGAKPTGAAIDMRFEFSAANNTSNPSPTTWADSIAQALSLPAGSVSCEAVNDAGRPDEDVLDCAVSILNDMEARSVLAAIGEDPDDYAGPDQFIAPMGIISAIETAPAAFWSDVAASQGTDVAAHVVAVATLVEVTPSASPSTAAAASATATASVTTSPTASSSPSATTTGSVSPTPTSSSTVSLSPTPTASTTASATATPSPSPSATVTPSITPSASPIAVHLANDWYTKTEYGEPDRIMEFDGEWYMDFRPSANDRTRLGRLDPATMPACPVVVNDTLSSPDDMVSCHGRVYFRAYSSLLDIGKELWEYDPVSGDVELVVDLLAGSSSSSYGGDGMACVGDYVLFKGDNGTTGDEPWLFDTTTRQVRLLEDIRPGTDDSYVSYIVGVSDMVACFRALSPTLGTEMWCFNATTEALSLYDIRVGGSSSSPSSPIIAVSNRYAIFKAHDGTNKGLWSIDTVLGTASRFLDNFPTTRIGSLSALKAIGDLVVASMNHDVPNLGIWHGPGMINMSDPSPHPVVLFDPEPGDTAGTTARGFARDGDMLYVGLEHEHELWMFNLRNMSVTGSVDVTPGEIGALKDLHAIDHTLMLVAEHPIADTSLLSYTPGGNHTVLACDTDPAPDTGTGKDLAAIGDTVWWAGSTIGMGTEGWFMNMTTGVTKFLGDLRPGSSSSNPKHFIEYHGQVYFAAYTGSSQLYRYNPTSGPELVDSTVTVSGAMAVLDDKLFFPGTIGNTGVEVLAFNGSTIQLAADLDPGTGSSYPRDFAVVTWAGVVDVLVGSYYTQPTGREPFVMMPDGTFTTMDTFSGTDSSSPANFVMVKDQVCLVATTATYGREVQCGGYAKDVREGADGSWPGVLVVDGDYIYFPGSPDANGDSVIRLNASEANMTLAVDLVVTGSGERVGYPTYMCKLGRTLFMLSSDDFMRLELPGLTAERIPGINLDSSPGGLVCMEDRVMLMAEDDSNSVGKALYEYIPAGQS